MSLTALTTLLETTPIFHTLTNGIFTDSMLDLLSVQDTQLSNNQLDWILHTRINYLNKLKRPNPINKTTNGQTIKHFVIV